MKLGIGTYTLTWNIGVPGYDTPSAPLDELGLIRMAAERKVPVVQFADNLALHNFDEARLEGLRSAALEQGIELEAGTRGSEPAHLRKYIDITQRLGGKLLRTLITTADLELAAQQIRSVIPELERHGIRLAVENHGLHTTRELKELFRQLSHPLIGCCLDTVNSFGALEDPERVIGELAPYTMNLHIKDFNIARIDHQMGFTVTGTAAGQGRLDIPKLLQDIEANGHGANAILELWTPYQDQVDTTAALELQWLEESLTYLQGLESFSNGE